MNTEQAKAIFKKHYSKASGKECDELIMEKMQYCIEAMLDFATSQKVSVTDNEIEEELEKLKLNIFQSKLPLSKSREIVFKIEDLVKLALSKTNGNEEQWISVKKEIEKRINFWNEDALEAKEDKNIQQQHTAELIAYELKMLLSHPNKPPSKTEKG